MARTKGSEALLAINEKKTQVEIAAALTKKLGRSISQQNVAGWMNGHHMPSGDVLVACFELYDIDLALWLKPTPAKKTAQRAAS